MTWVIPFGKKKVEIPKVEGIIETRRLLSDKDYLNSVIGNSEIQAIKKINSVDIIQPEGNHKGRAYRLNIIDGRSNVRDIVCKVQRTDNGIRPMVGEYEKEINTLAHLIGEQASANFKVQKVYGHDNVNNILVTEYIDGRFLSDIMEDINKELALETNKNRRMGLINLKKTFLRLSLRALADYHILMDNSSDKLKNALEKVGSRIYDPTEEDNDHYHKKLNNYFRRLIDISERGSHINKEDLESKAASELRIVADDLLHCKDGKTIIIADFSPYHIKIMEDGYVNCAYNYIRHKVEPTSIDELCFNILSSSREALFSLEDTRFGPEKLDVASLLGHHTLKLNHDEVIAHMLSFLEFKFNLRPEIRIKQRSIEINSPDEPLAILDSMLFYQSLKSAVGSSIGYRTNPERLSHHIGYIVNIIESNRRFKQIDETLGEFFRLCLSEYKAGSGYTTPRTIPNINKQ